MPRTIRWGAAALILAAISIACGSEDPLDRASGQPLLAETADRDASDNVAPQIDFVRFDPVEPRAGDTLRAIVEASDANGDPVSLEYEWTVAGTPIASRGAAVPLSHVRKGDAIRVTVTASDGHAHSEPHAAWTEVGNRPPQMSALRLVPASGATAGGEVKVVPTATDLDGDELSYHYTWWVNGSTQGTSGPVLSTELLRRGDTVRARVVASDGEDESNTVDSDTLTLVNAAPVFVSQPVGADEQGLFRYPLRAEDADGDRTLRFSLVTGPRGMVLVPGRNVLEWTPAADQSGQHVIEVAVDDLQGGQTHQRFEIVVDIPAAKEAPPAAPADPQD
jgi:hypothetical protein